MDIKFATKEETDDWNNLVIKNPDNGNIFQTKEFADIKAISKWKPRFLVINNIYTMLLERKIPALGYYWYIPKGPGISSADELKIILPMIKNFAQNNNVFAVKLEPELIEDEKTIKSLKESGLIICKGIQAANTSIIDISNPIDEVIASFSSKTRYNIRSAKKVEIETYKAPIDDKNCKLFYDMMIKTINGRSPLRNYEYFKNYWQLHDKAETGAFLFASFENKIISTDFITFLNHKAYRKDAASDHSLSIRGASALLEVYAIEFLKDKGITTYDLYGTPPSDQIKNHDHPFYGFGTFKAGFNSNITDYIGSLDLVIKPLAYKIWTKIGERLVRRVYKFIYHDIFY
jgi:lipid II:glycine glycyltransferase (peptidoglycan interpeptide bridge formation enzyme)